VYSLSNFAAALSPSFLFFMGTRFVQGLGYAFVAPVLMVVISEIAGSERQGLSMGYYGMATSAGVTTGPLLAGFVAQVDWRLTFVTIGLLGLILMGSIMVFFSKAGGKRAGITLRTLGRQLSATVANRNIALLSSAGFLAFFSQIGVMSFVSERLESPEFDLTSVDVGIVLGVSGFLGLVISPLSGKLVDLRGARCCASVGFALVGVSSFVIQYADEYLEFLALMSITGVGASFMWASLLTMVVRAYPSLKGTSSSVFNSARFAGYAFSPLALTPLYLSFGFEAIMTTCAALVATGLALAMATDRVLSRR
jgi:predicted MFS family arabinose efflux permease